MESPISTEKVTIFTIAEGPRETNKNVVSQLKCLAIVSYILICPYHVFRMFHKHCALEAQRAFG